MRTLSHYVNDCMIKKHETVFNSVMEHVNVFNISKVYTEMNVNNFGHAMAYLTVVHLMDGSEEVTREATRLVIEPLKNCDISSYRIRNQWFVRLTLAVYRTVEFCTRWLRRLNEFQRLM